MIGRIFGSRLPPDSGANKPGKPISHDAEILQQKFAGLFEKSGTQENPITFEQKAKELVILLEKSCPEEAAKLNKLIADHEQHLQELSNGGWKEVKKDRKGQMANGSGGDSMEKFRGETVKAVSDLCLAAMKKMGFDPPGNFSATGTPGWDSDIDTVFLPPPGMPEKMQIMGKLMFDAIFYEKFDTSPGKIFDTECYLRQAAIGYSTEKWLTSAAGKSSYANLELQATAFQMLIQCGSPDSDEWKTYKSNTLANASPALKPSMTAAFASVEQIEHSIAFNLKIQVIRDNGHQVPNNEADIDQLVRTIIKTKPQALSLAMMNYKTGVLFKIAKEIDQCKSQIDSITQRIAKSRNLSQKDLLQSERQLESYHLRIGTLALLRERFFDEGYISQGAFTKVCFVEEGQIHQSKIRDFRKTIQVSRQENIPMHELIAKNEGKKFILGEAQKKKSNNQQNIVSSQENLAMYKGHFEHALNHHTDLASYQKAVISQSKYSERTLGSAYAVLKEVKARATPGLEHAQKIQELETTLQTAYFKASELEMTKRKTQLNITTSKKLMMDAIRSKHPNLSYDKVEASVDQILKRQEPGNPLYDLRYEETLLPADIYFSQISALDQLGLAKVTGVDSDGNLVTDNPKLDAIVHARCGLITADQHIQALVKEVHEEGEKLTLKECGFNSKDEILAFNQEIEELTQKVYNLAVDDGVVETPIPPQDTTCNILNLWEEVAQ